MNSRHGLREFTVVLNEAPSQPVRLLRVFSLGAIFLLMGLGAGRERSDRAGASQSAAVSIVNMAFLPASVIIHPGDSVVWTNNDDRDHTVSSADGSFKSGNLASGQSFTHKFSKAGSFAYGCSYHPRMKGTVIVKD